MQKICKNKILRRTLFYSKSKQFACGFRIDREYTKMPKITLSIVNNQLLANAFIIFKNFFIIFFIKRLTNFLICVKILS